MKIVIIYTYFQSESSDYNLQFFVNKIDNEFDYIIVINGYYCSVHFPKLKNLTILRRENEGYDFGGHNYALNYIKNRNYDYYFFMNSGVIGPIVPHYFTDHWTSVFIKKINDFTKLVGTTIVCLPKSDPGGYGPKVEGFFFMTDSVGLELLKKEKTIFCNHIDKYHAVVDGEYGLSNCIIRNGYTIDCMLPRYQGIDWTDKNNYNLNDNIHPSRQNSNFNYSINPYDVIFHKWHWKDEQDVNLNIIKQYISENL
jgi:hypothetical protein